MSKAQGEFKIALVSDSWKNSTPDQQIDQETDEEIYRLVADYGKANYGQEISIKTIEAQKPSYIDKE